MPAREWLPPGDGRDVGGVGRLAGLVVGAVLVVAAGLTRRAATAADHDQRR
ncbi:hypothetical protein [Micromonospora luteifusca]|uniref:hypothetical protein n=1 Tax=Micromonospora luteifusca TaxID=709860 RepID=UPI0033BB9BE2